jgi:hypothetical protein
VFDSLFPLPSFRLGFFGLRIIDLVFEKKVFSAWANLPICSTDIPDIPTFFISQENILGYEYYHKTHGDNKTTH